VTKSSTLRTARYLAVLILLAAGMLLISSPAIEPTVRATGGYYDVMADCDGNYFGSFYECNNRIGTTWEQCKGEAFSSYGSCTYNAGLTHELPDFCDSARNEFYSHCLMQYGPEGWSPDPDAFQTCRDVSGIDQCE
jgi:hypothetical protein